MMKIQSHLWSGGLNLECNRLGVIVGYRKRALYKLCERSLSHHNEFFGIVRAMSLENILLNPRELLGFRYTDIFVKACGNEAWKVRTMVRLLFGGQALLSGVCRRSRQYSRARGDTQVTGSRNAARLNI